MFFFSSRRRHTRLQGDWFRRVLFRSRAARPRRATTTSPIAGRVRYRRVRYRRHQFTDQLCPRTAEHAARKANSVPARVGHFPLVGAPPPNSQGIRGEVAGAHPLHDRPMSRTGGPDALLPLRLAPPLSRLSARERSRVVARADAPLHRRHLSELPRPLPRRTPAVPGAPPAPHPLRSGLIALRRRFLQKPVILAA